MDLKAQEYAIAKKYRDNAIARQKQYYQKNKEKIKEKARNRYHNMTKEQKHGQVQLRKESIERQTPEEKEQLKAYMKEYAKNRYYNRVACVKS